MLRPGVTSLKLPPEEKLSSAGSSSLSLSSAPAMLRSGVTSLKLPTKEQSSSSSSWPFQPPRPPLVPTRKVENRSSDIEGPVAPGRERAKGGQ